MECYRFKMQIQEAQDQQLRSYSSSIRANAEHSSMERTCETLQQMRPDTPPHLGQSGHLWPTEQKVKREQFCLGALKTYASGLEGQFTLQLTSSSLCKSHCRGKAASLRWERATHQNRSGLQLLWELGPRVGLLKHTAQTHSTTLTLQGQVKSHSHHP